MVLIKKTTYQRYGKFERQPLTFMNSDVGWTFESSLKAINNPKYLGFFFLENWDFSYC